jgi:hypothetical protein
MRFGNSQYYFGLDESFPFIRTVKSGYWSRFQSNLLRLATGSSTAEHGRSFQKFRDL